MNKKNVVFMHGGQFRDEITRRNLEPVPQGGGGKWNITAEIICWILDHDSQPDSNNSDTNGEAYYIFSCT